MAAFGRVGTRCGTRRIIGRPTAAKYLDVITIALDLEVAVGELDALVAGRPKRITALQENIVGAGVGHRAAGVHANAAAIAVVGNAAIDARNAADEIEVTLLDGSIDAQLPARAVGTELGRVARRDRGLNAFLGRILGQVVDDAARCTDTF